MKIQRLSRRLIAVAVLGAAVMAAGTGCQQHQETTTTEAAAPAPRSLYRPAAGPGWNVSQLAFPTGDTASSAVLLSTVTPAEVRVGAPYAQQFHVTNLSSATLQNVILSASKASNLEVQSAKPEGAKSADGWNWNLGNLAPNETRVVEVTGRATEVGTSANCLSVSYNNLLCTAVRVTQPALAVTKSAPAEVLVCDEIPLVFEVRNTGTGVAQAVKLTDNLPAGLMTKDGQQSVTADVGDLAPGQAKRVTIQAKAARTGTYNNTGSVASAGGLTAQSNQTTTIVRQPVLAIACQAPERIFLGRNASFAFTLRNTGDTASKNTTLTVPLPAGATFVSATEGGVASATGVTWNLGDLAAGASRSVSVSLTPSGISTINLAATAQGVCAAPVTANCATAVQGIPAILLETVDLVDPIEVGGQTTYVITATNQGTANGTGIKIIAVLGDEQEFVSSAGATAGTTTGKRVEFAPLPSLAPKAKAEWRIVVKAGQAADVRFKVMMTSDQFSRPVEETESTNQYK